MFYFCSGHRQHVLFHTAPLFLTVPHVLLMQILLGTKGSDLYELSSASVSAWIFTYVQVVLSKQCTTFLPVYTTGDFYYKKIRTGVFVCVMLQDRT